ncbi:MAG: hypothetical protein ACI865_000324 [Flavobacteriaceae bacterium]
MPIALFTGVRIFKLRTKLVVLLTSILIITYLRFHRFNSTPLIKGMVYRDLALSQDRIYATGQFNLWGYCGLPDVLLVCVMVKKEAARLFYWRSHPNSPAPFFYGKRWH